MNSNSTNIASIVSELEDIHVRLVCGTDMMVALQEAMSTGTLTPQTTKNAMWGIFDYIDLLVKEMGKQVGNAGDALLEARKGAA